MNEAIPGAVFEGKRPKEIRAMLADYDLPLTLADVDAAWKAAYGDEEPNQDNERHQRTLILIAERYRAILRKSSIGRAIAYLSKQGFDLSLLSDDDLYAVGQEIDLSFVLAGQNNHDALGDGKDVPYPTDEDALHELVEVDEDTGAYVTEGGVVVGYRVEGAYDVEAILRAAGERLTHTEARLAAQKAEKKAWTDKIDAAYDPKVNKLQRHVDWLRKVYLPLAQGYIERYNARSAKPVRSLKLGLLTIQLGKTSKRIDVEDDAKVIAFLRALEADPANGLPTGWAEVFVNRKETVAKSAFSEDDKVMPVQLGAPAIAFVPGGEDTCTIK